MLDYLVNSFWQHPVALTGAAIAAVVILIWMTGSGSRQRFIVLRRTKETEQLARDLSRIASALERIANSQEAPTDFVGRPIPVGFERTIARNHAHAEEEVAAPVGEGNRAAPDAPFAPDEAAAAPAAARSAAAAGASPLADAPNPFGGAKKLELPNPLYRPK